VHPPFFCNLHSSSKPTKKNLMELVWRFKQLYLGNHSELDTYSYELFFSQWPIKSPPPPKKKKLTFPPESPCITFVFDTMPLNNEDSITCSPLDSHNVTTAYTHRPTQISTNLCRSIMT
jgi:hypothetical protein